MPRKRDPYEGLVRSYQLDDIRPIEYWNVQYKLSQPHKSWTSCTRYSSKVKADADLRRTRSWIASEPRTTKRVFRIVAHLGSHP
jgi:hypothetical protein